MNSVNSVPEIENLRVHIAPVGYEIDRVVLPAKQLRADKVILLVHANRSEDKATKFYESIKKELKKLNIEAETEYHDRKDLSNIIKVVREIIQKEGGNTIYVNLASGSKIQAIGGMMASMMFNDSNNVKPFYAEAQEYPGFSGKPISTGIKSIEYIPAYDMPRPDDRLVKALKIIMDKGGRISKKEMGRMAIDEGIIVVNAENRNEAMFASLDTNIISVLERQWRYVTVSKVGRTRWIEITTEGRRAAEFLA